MCHDFIFKLTVPGINFLCLTTPMNSNSIVNLNTYSKLIYDNILWDDMYKKYIHIDFSVQKHNNFWNVTKNKFILNHSMKKKFHTIQKS